MDRGSRTQKNAITVIAGVFFLLLLVDRFYWAQIAQWREDQATNLWLGYTQGLRHLPVGLISSRKLPNPNGMPLLGLFLSALPNLLSVSFFLGLAQMLLVLLAGWKAFPRNLQLFVFATLPALSSVVLRSTSVEFWNQYTITLLNIFFLYWAVRYLQTQSLWNLAPITVLILLAPAMYLAGVVNALVMALITLSMLVYKRPRMDHAWRILFVLGFLVLVSVFLTWLPYFRAVSLEQLARFSQIKTDPVSSVPLAFKHADPVILSSVTQWLLQTTTWIVLLQAVFSGLIFFWIIFRIVAQKNSDFDKNIVPVLALCGAFIALSYALSALLGGANWLSRQRSDQTVQFLPLVFVWLFLLPFAVQFEGRMQTIRSTMAATLLAAFVIVNLLCGFFIVHDHLQYRGRVLTEADVPLINKMQAVDFIARDWKAHAGGATVAVDYDLGGGKWNWVPEFGEKLTKWYSAPMTIGRSFDYELLRRYGLTNAQEGTQIRTFGKGRYLVTYAFLDPPTVQEGQITHHLFGRLRVSVVEK